MINTKFDTKFQTTETPVNDVSIQDIQDVHSEENYRMNNSFLGLPSIEDYDLGSSYFDGSVVAGLDGLTIQSMIDNDMATDLYGFLSSYAYSIYYPANDDSAVTVVLDYQKIAHLAIQNHITFNDTFRPDYPTYADNDLKREYNVRTHIDPDLTNDDLVREMHQSVSVTFKVRNNELSEFEVWFNPNKFAKDKEIQRHEPLYWFFQEYIRPCMLEPNIQQFHLNVDLNVPFNKVYVEENGKALKFKQFHNAINKQTKYLNNATNNDYYPDDVIGGNYADTLVIYDKTYDIINNKRCKSYISKQDMQALVNDDVNVTRFEFRTYKRSMSAKMLNNTTVLGSKFSIKYHYKKDGEYHTKSLKDILNRAYKNAKHLVTDNIVVDEEILHNTLDPDRDTIFKTPSL